MQARSGASGRRRPPRSRRPSRLSPTGSGTPSCGRLRRREALRPHHPAQLLLVQRPGRLRGLRDDDRRAAGAVDGDTESSGTRRRGSGRTVVPTPGRRTRRRTCALRTPPSSPTSGARPRRPAVDARPRQRLHPVLKATNRRRPVGRVRSRSSPTAPARPGRSRGGSPATPRGTPSSAAGPARDSPRSHLTASRSTKSTRGWRPRGRARHRPTLPAVSSDVVLLTPRSLSLWSRPAR